MSRLTAVERIDLIFLYGKYEAIPQVQRAFALKYGKTAPKKDTISSLIKKFKSSGSVKDASRKGKWVLPPDSTVRY